MRTLRRSLPAALLAVTTFLLTSSRAADLDPQAASVTLPGDIQWKKGANQDSATLFGDSSKPGVYIQLLRWHAGNTSRPHFHSTDRYILVVSGTWWMSTSHKYDPSTLVPVPQGSWVIHHANEIHWDGAKDADCVLYIVGTGPMTTSQAEAK